MCFLLSAGFPVTYRVMKSDMSSSSSQARITSVNRLTRKPSVLGHSDDAVLNLILKSNWNLTKPTALTGSTNKKPESELYPLQGEMGRV